MRARIAAAGHGGQVLVSDATRVLVEHALPRDVDLRDLGPHRLKDIEQPEQLYQLLIEGLPDAFPPIRTVSVRLTNLPIERSSFVGREHELMAAIALLEQRTLAHADRAGRHRQDTAGPGRSRRTSSGASPMACTFADLSPITDASLVPAAIAGVLTVREQPGRALLDSLSDYLRDRHLLLVLDNLEQVVDGASIVGRLLDAAPRLTVLATSRVPLHIAGEQEYPVPPLAVPDPQGASDLESLARNEAVALFIDRAAAVRPGMQLTAGKRAERCPDRR